MGYDECFSPFLGLVFSMLMTYVVKLIQPLVMDLIICYIYLYANG